VGSFSAAKISFDDPIALSSLHDGRGAQFRGVTFAGAALVAGIVSRSTKSSFFATFSGKKSYSKFEGLFKTTTEPQTCLAASVDGSKVASGTADGSVTVFGLSESFKFRKLMQTQPHTFFVSSVCFSPDAGHILSSSGDRSLMIQKVQPQLNYPLWIALLSLLVLILAMYLK
jgi:WD40 repeat protein